MSFINKKLLALFLSLILLTYSNSIKCKPKQFIKEASSTFSKISDVILCTTAVFVGYNGFQKIIAPITDHNAIFPPHFKLGVLYCVSALMVIPYLSFKYKRPSEIYAKLEDM